VRRKPLLAAIVLVSLPSLLTIAPTLGGELVSVVKVHDGDTVTLSDGIRVRLIQIDAPEISGRECYSIESRRSLTRLVRDRQVSFEHDPGLDKIDRYGRLLGYLFVDGVNLNIKMVEVGAASPYFYRGERGIYAGKLFQAAENAKSLKLGLWRKCPATDLRPNAALDAQDLQKQFMNKTCDTNYEGCVPLFPPDLDCSEIRRLGLNPVKVIGKDVHRLDQDGNGIGCS
jgi:micrococcal nuclease